VKQNKIAWGTALKILLIDYVKEDLVSINRLVFQSGIITDVENVFSAKEANEKNQVILL
jgi:hypothetical protein